MMSNYNNYMLDAYCSCTSNEDKKELDGTVCKQCGKLIVYEEDND